MLPTVPLQLFRRAQQSLIQVHSTPLEAEGLSLAQSERQRESETHAIALSGRDGEQPLRFFDRERFDFLFL
jgi:hypothetical protein